MLEGQLDILHRGGNRFPFIVNADFTGGGAKRGKESVIVRGISQFIAGCLSLMFELDSEIVAPSRADAHRVSRSP